MLNRSKGGFRRLVAALALLAAMAADGAQAQDRLQGATALPDFSRLPRFFSSDPAYDAFANEYFMRHLSVDARGVYQGGGPMLGATDHMWVVEWDNWLFPWIDRGAMGLARQGGSDADIIRNTLRTAAVDKYGYVFGARPEPEPVDSLGGYKPTFSWPWPKYNRNTTVTRPTGWEFNDPADGARAEWTAKEMALEPGYVGHCLVGRVTGARPELTTPGFDVDVFQVPIIELDIAYAAGAGADRLVDGLRIYWSTDAHPGFSEERMVTSDFSVLPPRANPEPYAPWVSPPQARFALFFPMLLHPEWGRSGRRITGLKIVPAGPGANGATVTLNYVRATYDVRMTTTNTALINGVHRFAMWSGDRTWLATMLPRCRRAVTYLNEHLQGRKHGLLCLDWLAGHDGLGGDLPGHGLIGSYWDLLPAGRFDLESSTGYTTALNAMAELEDAARRLGIACPTEPVIGPDNKTPITYRETPASLRALARRVKREIEKRFWMPETGRFCRNIDAEGTRHDFGFLHFNVLALAGGIGTPSQRESILRWIDGRRIVAGDTSTGADILRWRFAPRTSTRRNESYYFWPWNWEKARDPGGANFVWGDQMQDGGAVGFTSLFDLMARCRTGDQAEIDRAFGRTRQVQAWFADVCAAGGDGKEFYRAYYNGRPERGRQQGGGPPGGLGLDREFLSDASLGTAVIPLAFLGLEARQEGILDIAPSLPTQLDRLGVENVLYRGNHLRIEAGRHRVSLSGSRIADATGLKLRITFRAAPSGAVALVDGKPSRHRRLSDGAIEVTCALGPVTVELRPAGR